MFGWILTFFVQVRWYIGNSLNTDNFSIKFTSSQRRDAVFLYEVSIGRSKTRRHNPLFWPGPWLIWHWVITLQLPRYKEWKKRRRGFRGKIFLTKKTKKSSRKNRIYVLSSCLTNWIHSAVKCISGFKRKIKQTTRLLIYIHSNVPN